MGNSCPFHADLRIGYHVRTIVLGVQIIIYFGQRFRRQALAFLRHLVGDHLIFREHGLAVHGSLKAVQIVVQQIGPFFFVRGVGQQVFHQQDLIAGGGHFRHEDPIMGVHGRLGVVGVPGVHGMAHLMDQGEQIVHIAGIVQQDVRVAVVGTGGVGAAALALVLVHIDPAVFKTFPDHLEIVLSQRGQSLQHGLPGLRKGNLLGYAGDNGGVDVVHMQFVHAQQTFAQAYIAMHLIQIPVHGVHQIPIHLRGYVDHVYGRLQGAVIVAGPGLEDQLFHLAAVNAGQRAGILFVHAV